MKDIKMKDRLALMEYWDNDEVHGFQIESELKGTILKIEKEEKN